MPSDTTSPPESRAPERLGLVLAIAIPAGLSTLWATPRPAPPSEPPVLALPAADVAAELAAQEALAARAPDTEDEVRRRRLYLEHGLAEVQRNDFPEQAAQRAAALAQLRVALEAEGDDAVAAARARDVARVMPALRGEDGETDETRASELGAFPAMLERYGAVIAGHRVAPELVIRTMFHARWNAIHGLAPTEGMSAVARRAYFGWLAVEGGNAPVGMRLEALDAYAAAGGTRVLETRAWLEHEAGDAAAAGADYERACDQTGSVRLCNHALAELQAELEGESQP